MHRYNRPSTESNAPAASPAARIAPRLPGLRASVLHQDANDHNVIVDAADPDRIAGLIDFGDMCFGRTVNELAITLAYALIGAEDIYAAARAVIAAYVAEFPLEEAEAEVIGIGRSPENLRHRTVAFATDLPAGSF